MIMSLQFYFIAIKIFILMKIKVKLYHFNYISC